MPFAAKFCRLLGASLALCILVISIDVAASTKNEELLSLADNLYSRYLLCRETTDIEKAYVLLKQCNETETKSFNIKWRLARTLNEYGAVVKDSFRYWEEGALFAAEAIDLEPSRPEGYLWLAILKGQIGRAKGILQSLASANQMKLLLEKSMELDPLNAYTYHILASLYRLIPGWPVSFGDNKKALELAKKAIELEPGSHNLWWGLYEALVEVGKMDEAERVLENILRLSDEDPFSHLYNQPFPKEIKRNAEKALTKNHSVKSR